MPACLCSGYRLRISKRSGQSPVVGRHRSDKGACPLAPPHGPSYKALSLTQPGCLHYNLPKGYGTVGVETRQCLVSTIAPPASRKLGFNDFRSVAICEAGASQNTVSGGSPALQTISWRRAHSANFSMCGMAFSGHSKCFRPARHTTQNNLAGGMRLGPALTFSLLFASRQKEEKLYSFGFTDNDAGYRRCREMFDLF